MNNVIIVISCKFWLNEREKWSSWFLSRGVRVSFADFQANCIGFSAWVRYGLIDLISICKRS